ncbi:glycosyltransferase family 2 protein [Microvirga sp. GCM10011540]|uniref:glycosyltransferase family 2 protein n=1 Tax=Microvirga sp. GCM10011540 TaxID=3317338 RepID=UPI00360A4CDC
MLEFVPVDPTRPDLRPESGPVRVRHPDPSVTLSYAPKRVLRNRWLMLEARFPEAGLVDLVIELRLKDAPSLFLEPRLVGRNHFSGRFRAGETVEEILLHLSGSGDLERPLSLRIDPAPRLARVLALARRAVQILREEPRTLAGRGVQYLSRLRHGGGVLAAIDSATPSPPSAPDAFARWIELFDEHPRRDQGRHAARLERLPARPRISVLLPVRGPAERLVPVIRDLDEQIYPEWELLIGSGLEQAKDLAGRLPRETGNAGRIRFVETGGDDRAGILNALLQAASGEFVIPLPDGGRLRPHALLECALAAQRHPAARLIYADEDRLDPSGQRTSPRFKPAWSPDLLASHDYIGGPAWFRTSSLVALGGWRAGLDGAEDHDLKLRYTRAVRPGEIIHLAKVLLHQEETDAMAAPPPPHREARLRAVREHLAREGGQARAVEDPRSPYPRISYVPKDPPLVSLLIPTRDNAPLLSTCVTSILQRTQYQNFEIIVVNHESKEPDTFRLFESWAGDPRIRIMTYEGPFNYSDINNRAAEIARGSILGLINNDIEVISGDWLGEMVGYAVQPRIGCVGAKLFYGNDTIQHAGIVLGLGGGAGHGHKFAARAERGYLDQLATARDVSAVTAACLLVRTEVFREVGGLDPETFAVAFNDVDFCLKVMAAGYTNVWTPFAELYHHESVSRGHDVTPAKARRFAREVRALQERWGPWLLSDPYYSPHLSTESEDYRIRTR